MDSEFRFKEITKELAQFPQKPKLLAVSKGQPIEKIIQLARLGQRDFGENYVQELIEKKLQLSELGIQGPRFHFIGHLQTNKVKALLPHVVAIQSLDSLKLATEINKHATAPFPVWIQVNIDSEESKHGFLPEELAVAIPNLLSLKNLDIQGWMVIPDPNANAEESFKKLIQIAGQNPDVPAIYSMGMSQDYKVAAKCGANFIRIGKALFGPRS